MSNVTPLFPVKRGAGQVFFDRAEIATIMNLYGRMVSEGYWRDYAIEMHRDIAIFSAFHRASERPEIRIVKRPDLAAKQGQYMLLGDAGAVLRRGHDLRPLLAPLERKLMKLVEA